MECIQSGGAAGLRVSLLPLSPPVPLSSLETWLCPWGQVQPRAACLCLNCLHPSSQADLHSYTDGLQNAPSWIIHGFRFSWGLCDGMRVPENGPKSQSSEIDSLDAVLGRPRAPSHRPTALQSCWESWGGHAWLLASPLDHCRFYLSFYLWAWREPWAKYSALGRNTCLPWSEKCPATGGKKKKSLNLNLQEQMSGH